MREHENARLPARFAAALEQVTPAALLAGRAGELGVESPGVAHLFWGKAAWSTFQALDRALGPIAGPVLGIAPRLPEPSISVQWALGDHPLPGERSFAAGARLLDFFDWLRRVGATRLHVHLSGGASSLAWLPPAGWSREALRRELERLYRAPLSIAQLNARRSRLCALKGGGAARWLARLAPATRATVHVVSDVLPYGPEIVGSGPFWDQRTPHAVVADSRALLARLEPRSHEVLGPRDWRAWLARVAAQARSGRSRAFGGEPLLRVPAGAGEGGRQTHLAAALALELAPELAQGRVEIVCASSDGVDGRSGAAGAWLSRALGAKLVASAEARRRLRESLARHDTASGLGRLGALLPERETGTNVQDVVWVRAR